MTRNNRCLGLAELEEALECNIRLPKIIELLKPKKKSQPIDEKALELGGKALGHILCQHPEIKHAELTVVGKQTLFYFIHGNTATQALIDNKDLHTYTEARATLERAVDLAI